MTSTLRIPQAPLDVRSRSSYVDGRKADSETAPEVAPGA